MKRWFSHSSAGVLSGLILFGVYGLGIGIAGWWFPTRVPWLIHALPFFVQVAAFVVGMTHSGAFRKEARWLAVGVLLIGIGDQFWMLNGLRSGSVLAVVPLAGPFWLLGHILMAMGGLRLAWRRHVGRGTLMLLDCFVATMVLTFFIWKQQESISAGYHFSSLWLAACFYGSGLAEIGWFLAATVLIIPITHRRCSSLWLGSGILAIALIDNLFALDVTAQKIPGLLFVLLDVVAYITLMLGMRALPQEGPRWRVEREVSSENRQLQSFLPYLMTVGFIVSMMLYSWVRQHPVHWELEVALVTVAVLLVLRQSILMVENHVLTKRIRLSQVILEETVARRTRQLALLHDYVLALGDTLEEEVLWQHTMDFGYRLLQPVLLSIENPDPVAAPLVERAPENATAAAHRHSVVIKEGSSAYATLVAHRLGGNFIETEIGLLESVARSLAAAISNARAFAKAREQADRDPMTGLLNHRAAMERLHLSLEHAREDQESLAILMMDVNNFKLFNDTYGHPVGDSVLQLIARVLQEIIPPSSIIARYGGDEFVVGVYGTSKEQIALLPAQLNAAIRQEHYHIAAGNPTIPLGISCGYAFFPADAERVNELIAIADRRLFEAKDRGEVVTTSHRPPLRIVTDDTDQGILAAMDAMLTAVDNKDRYTRAHSEDVTAYALWLAEGLGATPSQLQILKLAAMLHDIGKIGVPDDVLRKPGHLNPEEVELMRRHPTLGAMIVAAMPGMEQVVPVVRSHHERWDGAGYPDGTAGEETPYLARIVAIADAFSAITTSRPYRSARDWDSALAEIYKGAGTQFDPTMARVFVTVMRQYLNEQEAMRREQKAS